jgi:hypothetical protein
MGRPFALGIGETGPPYPEIRGSQYVQGPNYVGTDTAWPIVGAASMLAPLNNPESPPPFIPGAIIACAPHIHNPYTLGVIGPSAFLGEVDINDQLAVGDKIWATNDIISQSDVWAFCGDHKLSDKKNFDIPHPTREGWRLTHSCVEGPEAAVYVRGRVRNRNEIELPEYWTKLIDPLTITVSLTPIGSHQSVIVKRIGDNKIYLQSNGGMPIDCFYHVFAERIDTEKLIPEYQGTIEDYPGDNSQRSIAGYHYDVRN